MTEHKHHHRTKLVYKLIKLDQVRKNGNVNKINNKANKTGMCPGRRMLKCDLCFGDSRVVHPMPSHSALHFCVTVIQHGKDAIEKLNKLKHRQKDCESYVSPFRSKKENTLMSTTPVYFFHICCKDQKVKISLTHKCDRLK